MTVAPSPSGDLTLGHLLAAAGLNPADVIILRHPYRANGLTTSADLTAQNVLDYVRRQDVGNKLGKTPPFIWLNFMADGGRRCRFLTAYENHGELAHQQLGALRDFDFAAVRCPVLSEESIGH